jgi:hypothetical protein
VAHSAPPVVEAWLARAHIEPGAHAEYRRRLAKIGADGYSAIIETLPIEIIRPLAERLATCTTLEERQRIVALINDVLPYSPESLLVSPKPRTTYLLRSIDVPVLDAAGQATMAISLTNLPHLRGAEIVALGERMRLAARMTSPHAASTNGDGHRRG